MKNVSVNALYVFYTTDPDDDRVDNAFIGKVLSVDGPTVMVESVKLCPSDDKSGHRALSREAYQAYPLPPASDPVWAALPKLLVPTEGWPSALKTVKGLPEGSAPVVAALVNKKDANTVGVSTLAQLPRELSEELARFLFRASLP